MHLKQLKIVFVSTCQNTYSQAQVVQQVGVTILGIAWFLLLTIIQWIAIYPVDSVIQPSKNWGQ